MNKRELEMLWEQVGRDFPSLAPRGSYHGEVVIPGVFEASLVRVWPSKLFSLGNDGYAELKIAFLDKERVRRLWELQKSLNRISTADLWLAALNSVSHHIGADWRPTGDGQNDFTNYFVTFRFDKPFKGGPFPIQSLLMAQRVLETQALDCWEYLLESNEMRDKAVQPPKNVEATLVIVNDLWRSGKSPASKGGAN